MIKSFKICMLILLLSSKCLIAIGQSTLSGVVLFEDNLPAPGATVRMIRDNDPLSEFKSITDKNGYYEFKIVGGAKYAIVINYFGYETIFFEALSTVNALPIKVDPKKLAPKITNLAEVTVQGSVPLFQKLTDRLIINVSNTIMAGGGNALDVLERAPGVVVDKQNNMISVAGKNGVSVMINGKLNRMPQDALLKMLESINGSNIEKIELINSSSKEDAEGSGGLINIVLKKSTKEGFSGSYNVSLGVGKYEKTSLGADFGYHRNKIDIYGNISSGRNRAYASFGNDREIFGLNGISNSASNFATRLSKNLNLSGEVGLDYAVGKKTTLGVLLSSFINHVNLNENGETYFGNPVSVRSLSRIKHHEVNRWSQYLTNFNISHSFENEDKISMDLDYLYFYNKNPHEYLFQNYSNANSPDFQTNESRVEKLTPIKFYVGKVDYQKKFNNRLKFETGLKSTYSTLKNNINVEQNLSGNWLKDPGFSQDVNMEESILAAYGTLKYDLDADVQFTLGLRYEHSNSQLADSEGNKLIDRSYGNLFPSVNASKKLGESGNLQISYNRRIMRPTYSYLAPYVHFVDESTFITGNMSLMSAISDNIEASYQFDGKYIFTAGYVFSKNPIVPYQIFVDNSTNTQRIRAENMKNSKLYSLGFTFPVKITDWWTMQNNVLGFYNSNISEYQSMLISKDLAYFNLNTNHSFKLRKGYTGEIIGMYQSKSLFGMAYLKRYGKVSLGLKKSLSNDKGTFRLTVDDLFWNMNYSIDNPQPALGFNQSFKGVFSEPRVLRLTFTRSFGKSEKKERRSSGAQEEKDRASN